MRGTSEVLSKQLEGAFGRPVPVERPRPVMGRRRKAVPQCTVAQKQFDLPGEVLYVAVFVEKAGFIVPNGIAQSRHIARDHGRTAGVGFYDGQSPPLLR